MWVTSTGALQNPRVVAKWVFPVPKLPIEQDVFARIEVFTAGEFPDQGFVDRRLGAKIEVLQGLEHRELRALDAPLGGAA